jgi:PEP-CTERM motif
MNSGFKLWVPVLLVASELALGLAPSAKADAIYTLTTNLGGFVWSFEVPAIITTDTTITSFLSTNIDPSGFYGVNGCTTIDSTTLLNPQTSNAFFLTHLSPCGGTDVSGFGVPLIGFGSFTLGPAHLTISPSGVPEPSSLLLLAGGLTFLSGLRRRKALGY